MNHIWLYLSSSLLLVSILFFSCTPELDDEWYKASPVSWPLISMVNEVWFESGERYIDPSFDYAATGFLLEYEERIYAATAKHVLWIAKPAAMKHVNPDPYLKKWVMHPKRNLKDSVVLGSLVNVDTTELLQGPASSIQERDWLLFETKYVSPRIQPLRPSFRQLFPGEKLYYTGCPYKEGTCITGSGKVLRHRGDRIIFSLDEPNPNIGGASGSPLIDSVGQVVGILSGTSINPIDGSPAFYGISTHYLKKILEDSPNKNQALISIADVLRREIEEGGLGSAIAIYEEIVAKDEHFFQYSVSPEEFYTVASELQAAGKSEDAIGILKLSLKDQYYFSRTHSLMGQVYAELGQITSAKNALNIALQLSPANQAAADLLLELEKN